MTTTLAAGCGIQIGGEEWGGGKVCVQSSPEPIAIRATPRGWGEPVQQLLGQATLPATGTMLPPIVGASPNSWDGGGALWAEKGVPLSLSLQVEPSEITRIEREPHLGNPESACPDQVVAPAILSLRSEIVTIETTVQLVLEPNTGIVTAALPPERGQVDDIPEFVRDFRHDRTWLSLESELTSGAWGGEISWRGETDQGEDRDPLVDVHPIGRFEARPL